MGQVTELIGSGSYGSVCEAVDDHKGERWGLLNRSEKRLKESKRGFQSSSLLASACLQLACVKASGGDQEVQAHL